MTRGEILSMSAGWEMDILVAREVLYMDECDKWRPLRWDSFVKDDGDCEHEKCYPVGNAPKYSTDISAAWEVVKKLIAENDTFCLTLVSGGEWLCDIDDSRTLIAHETPMMAICKTALLEKLFEEAGA